MRRRSPTKNPTCAKNGVYLRQEPGIPAPSAFYLRPQGLTCAKNWVYLHQDLPFGLALVALVGVGLSCGAGFPYQAGDLVRVQAEAAGELGDGCTE